MIDGPPPPVVSTALDAESLTRLAARLKEYQALLDGAVSTSADTIRTLGSELNEAAREESTLPPLEPGLHLYRDVVLGVVSSVGAATRAQRNASEQAAEKDNA